MTSLAAWVGVDGRGTSSLYFVSDSRLTWAPAGLEWSLGRKLFASKTTTDIFGYCGDVLFPSLVLGQLESLLNASVLFVGGEAPYDRHELFVRMIQKSLESYPTGNRQLLDHSWCTKPSRIEVYILFVESRMVGSTRLDGH